MENRIKSKATTSAIVILGLGFLLIGTFALLFWAYGFICLVNAQNWVPSDCKIISSEKICNGDDFSAQIYYEYNFEGKNYTGCKIRIFERSDNCGKAASFYLKKYRKGRTSTCYVNPATPEEALLEKNITIDDIVLPCGLSILFIIAGTSVLAFVRYIRAKEKRKSLPEQMKNGLFEIEREPSLIFRFVSFTLVTVIWNLLTWIGFITFRSNLLTVETGSFPWALKIICWAFPAVGLLMVCKTFVEWVRVSFLNTKMYCSGNDFRNGEKIRLQWEICDSFGLLRNLVVIVEYVRKYVGKENISYDIISSNQIYSGDKSITEAVTEIPEVNLTESKDLLRRVKVKGKCPFPFSFEDIYPIDEK